MTKKFRSITALILLLSFVLVGCGKEVVNLDANGISINLPDGFTDTDDYGNYLYHKSFDENTDVYIAYSSYIPVGQTDIQEYNNDQVLSLMTDYIFNNVATHYGVVNNAFELNNTTRESVNILNSSFTYDTGSMHIFEKSDDLYYAIYYGNVYIPEYNFKCPTYWIAFGTDTIDNRENIIDSLNQTISTVEYSK